MTHATSGSIYSYAELAAKLSRDFQETAQSRIWVRHPDLTQKLISSARTGNTAFLNLTVSEFTDAQSFVAALMEAEEHLSESQLEHLYLAGLEKFQRSLIFLEALGAMHFSRGEHNRALQYLKSVARTGERPDVIKMCIISSYELLQHHLVWDFFSLLVPASRADLEDSMIWVIAESAMHMGQYREAENLLHQIREKKRLPELPSLDEIVAEQFSSEKERTKWRTTVWNRLKKQSSSRENLGEWLQLSLLLMHESRYHEAYELLMRAKSLYKKETASTPF